MGVIFFVGFSMRLGSSGLMKFDFNWLTLRFPLKSTWDLSGLAVDWMDSKSSEPRRPLFPLLRKQSMKQQAIMSNADYEPASAPAAI